MVHPSTLKVGAERVRDLDTRIRLDEVGEDRYRILDEIINSNHEIVLRS